MASTTIVVGRVAPIRIHSAISLGSLGPAVRLTAGLPKSFSFRIQTLLEERP
jgi:hypothetical protein